MRQTHLEGVVDFMGQAIDGNTRSKSHRSKLRTTGYSEPHTGGSFLQEACCRFNACRRASKGDRRLSFVITDREVACADDIFVDQNIRANDSFLSTEKSAAMANSTTFGSGDTDQIRFSRPDVIDASTPGSFQGVSGRNPPKPNWLTLVHVAPSIPYRLVFLKSGCRKAVRRRVGGSDLRLVYG